MVRKSTIPYLEFQNPKAFLFNLLGNETCTGLNSLEAEQDRMDVECLKPSGITPQVAQTFHCKNIDYLSHIARDHDETSKRQYF